jgi:hypothetical protein
MKRDLSRQSFLGNNSDAVLAGVRVAIVGLCGGGSHVSQQLAHIGVGEFVLCDPDIVEESNLNRMVSATHEDAVKGRGKVAVTRGKILDVNPSAKIVQCPGSWQSYALELRKADVVFGCVDSYSERSQLEIMCRRFLIPYIDVGMDVSSAGSDRVISGQVILSMPGYPCMRCMGFLNEGLLAREAQAYGEAGGKPQVVWPNGVLASTAVGMFMTLTLPWHSQGSAPSLFMEYDGNTHSVFASRRMIAISSMTCRHFDGPQDLGDPFFDAALDEAA